MLLSPLEETKVSETVKYYIIYLFNHSRVLASR